MSADMIYRLTRNLDRRLAKGRRAAERFSLFSLVPEHAAYPGSHRRPNAPMSRADTVRSCLLATDWLVSEEDQFGCLQAYETQPTFRVDVRNRPKSPPTRRPRKSHHARPRSSDQTSTARSIAISAPRRLTERPTIGRDRTRQRFLFAILRLCRTDTRRNQYCRSKANEQGC
jgi:hypothetical protein